MPQGEKPRSEPEIIPPDHAERVTPRARVFTDAHSNERVSVENVRRGVRMLFRAVVDVAAAR